MKYIFLLILSLFYQIAVAAEIKAVYDGSESVAVISAKDLNRIKVVDDRIRDIKYNSDELEVNSDNKLGDIYLKPIFTGASPINIFVLTESGKTYKLILTPQKVPSSQIILKDIGGSGQTVSLSASPGIDYPEKANILELIKIMSERKSPASTNETTFKISSENNTLRSSPSLKVKSIFLYIGEHAKGRIIKIKNITSEDLKISEKTFFSNGVRAIKLEKENLLPGEEILGFIVFN